MAKRIKAPPARPPVDGAGVEVAGEEHSLLLRSAESLGRVIGVLQRQLDDATRRLSPNGHKGAKGAAGRSVKAAATKRKRQTSAGAATKKAVARKSTTAKRKRAAR